MEEGPQRVVDKEVNDGHKGQAEQSCTQMVPLREGKSLNEKWQLASIPTHNFDSLHALKMQPGTGSGDSCYQSHWNDSVYTNNSRNTNAGESKDINDV